HPGDHPLNELLLLTPVEEQLEGSLVLRDDAKAGGLPAAEDGPPYERAGDGDRLWITGVERGRHVGDRLRDDRPRGDQVVANALAVVDDDERPGRRGRGPVRIRVRDYDVARVRSRIALVRALVVEAIEARDPLHRLLASAHGFRESCYRVV